jgi:Integrase zinc binding domain
VFKELKNEYKDDEEFRRIFELKDSISESEHVEKYFLKYTRVRELLYYQRRLCIPDTGMRSVILKEMHDIATAGHLEIRRTYLTVRKKFYWNNMKRNMKMYVTSYD